MESKDELQQEIKRLTEELIASIQHNLDAYLTDSQNTLEDFIEAMNANFETYMDEADDLAEDETEE